ncbi:transcriptional regulator [Streptomyces sp. NPDC003032]
MIARPRAARRTNESLQVVIEEAGCSNTGLARRVNSCGAEHGLDLHYDKTSVARWLQGQQPRGRVPAIIAEALGRKLGRTVTVDEIGMRPAPRVDIATGLRFEPTVEGALQQVSALWYSDAHRNGWTPGESLATSVLVQASRDWLIADPDPAIRGNGHVEVGPADVMPVRATTAALADLDHRFGSGRIRPAAVCHLSTVVTELLEGSYDDSLGRQVLGAAARLTELAGYMAVDINQPGLAQRYYIQALRLAQAASDRDFGGYMLASGMAHVALTLGNPREAVQLARVAREGVRGPSADHVQAISYATEARGRALLGDTRACEKATEHAVEALERSDHGERPDWAAHIDRAYLAEELARCHQDLKQFTKATQWAQEALRGCSPGWTRRRALRLLLLASIQLQQEQVEEARGTASQALEALKEVRSGQCSAALDAFFDRLKELGNEKEARALLRPEERD